MGSLRGDERRSATPRDCVIDWQIPLFVWLNVTKDTFFLAEKIGRRVQLFYRANNSASIVCLVHDVLRVRRSDVGMTGFRVPLTMDTFGRVCASAVIGVSISPRILRCFDSLPSYAFLRDALDAARIGEKRTAII